MAIHAFIKGMFCFACVLFAALGAFAVCFTDAPEDDRRVSGESTENFEIYYCGPSVLILKVEYAAYAPFFLIFGFC